MLQKKNRVNKRNICGVPVASLCELVGLLSLLKPVPAVGAAHSIVATSSVTFGQTGST